MKKHLYLVLCAGIFALACSHEITPGQLSSGPQRQDPNAVVQGRVTIPPTLTPNSNATLFIIARSKDNPVGPPLAVKAITSPVFPLDFEMSQENVMGSSSSGKRFTGAITLRARLDQDGNAMTVSEGDIMSSQEQVVTVGDRQVKIELDTVANE